MTFYLALASSVLFVLFGCDSNETHHSDGLKKYRGEEIAPDQGVEVEGLNLSGNGVVKFIAPLSTESMASKHIALEFTKLDPSKTEVEITLMAFADKNLENGIEIKLYDGGAFIRGDRSAVELSERLSFIDWNTTNHLRFDIHNNEDPAHIIIWNESIANASVAEENEVFNSEHFEQNMTGRGQGTFFGLKLNNATVSELLLAEAMEHDHGDSDHDEDHGHDEDHDHAEGDHD
jgi:hypothetical protein